MIVTGEDYGQTDYSTTADVWYTEQTCTTAGDWVTWTVVRSEPKLPPAWWRWYDIFRTWIEKPARYYAATLNGRQHRTQARRCKKQRQHEKRRYWLQGVEG